MPSEAQQNLLSRLKASKRLPSPPGTALRVLELCRQDDAEINGIADTIMSDPALSGRLLKYANSPMVGAGRAVTSVRSAVLLMGLRTVKVTALGFSLVSPDFCPRCQGFDLSQFWTESFVTAVIARRLASDFPSIDREEAFTAGLLSQIGRLALANGLPEEYSEVMQLVQDGMSVAEAERETLGIDYAEFGTHLLTDWQLPESLIEAVCEQEVLSAGDALDEPSLARVLQLAVRLMPVFTRGDDLPQAAQQAARAALDTLNVDEDKWQVLAEEIKEHHEVVTKLFAVEFLTDINVFDLYAEAQEEISRVGMVAQLERAQALEENRSLLHRASTDALTGVANRARFDERMEELMNGLRRGHGHFALLMVDIDHFKRFNDTYGHDVGDAVLKEVAQTLHKSLREVDLLARYGGEEFAILAPNTDRRGACIVAVRACKNVEQLCVRINGLELRVTISAGLALTSDYADCPAAETLISDADKQLYRSKHASRNTWSYLDRTASQLMAPAAVS